MRIAAVIVSVALSISSRAAEPLYIDALMETPVERLQTYFSDLERSGCYAIGGDRYVQIDIEAKSGKPWRIALTSAPPCGGAQQVRPVDIRERSGVALGDSAERVTQRLGRPELVSRPESGFQQFGEREYFYVCRVEEMCARHTSVFFRDGIVSAIVQWYSE